MRRTLPTLLVPLLLAPLCTAAEPAAPRPGAVAQFMAAQDLFALGRAAKDPLAVLAAARLAATVDPDDVDRIPTPAGDAVPASHPDGTTMFTVAKALADTDEPLADLVARSLAESVRLPHRSLIRSTRGIAGQSAQAYDIAFFGDTVAEVGLLGDGKSDLDLAVTDAKGTLLCLDQSPSDRALCRFVPGENGLMRITITNRGNAAASYSLLTN